MILPFGPGAASLPGPAAAARRLVALPDAAASGPAATGHYGAKAARLAAALRAGYPVLPGWVVPVRESRAAARAAADAVGVHGMPAGRRAVLDRPIDPALAAEARAAVQSLGGRVIVRSSSPLESDPRWSGAFSSVTEVGPDDVAAAIRSCWAAAFGVDPLERLAACGLPLTALELGLVIQPELRPDAGGVARVSGGEVTVEGVAGHPGPLLSGWVEGASAQARLGSAAAGRADVSDGGLAALVGETTVAAVASLAARVCAELGDDTTEWAAADATIWLLQSLRSTPADLTPAQHTPAQHTPAQHTPAQHTPAQPTLPGPTGASAAPLSTAVATAAGGTRAGAGPGAHFLADWADPADPRLAEAAVAAFQAPSGTAGSLAARQWMPLLAAVAQAQGQHVPGRPAAPGTAAGRLVRCRPHERPDSGGRDAILLIDRPLPALAPLLFGARGVISRAGAAGSHLAEVARSLGVPMVIGCRAETVLAARPDDRTWIAAIDGAAGDVALLAAS